MAVPSRPPLASPAIRLAGTIRTATARYRLVRVVVAAALALLVGSLTHRAQHEAAQTVAAWGPSRPVLVATHELAAGEIVGPDHVRLLTVPAGLVPDDAIDELAGAARTRQSIAVGEILRAARLDTSSGSATAARIPTSMLAVTLDARDTPAAIGDTVALYDLVDGRSLVGRADVIHRDEHTVTVAALPDAIGRVVAAMGSGGVIVVMAGPAG